MKRMLLWSVGTSTNLCSGLHGLVRVDNLLVGGDNRLYSDNITNCHTSRHQTLRYNNLELHLWSVRDLQLYSCFVFFCLLSAIIFYSDFRLPPSSHNLKDIFWILHYRNLINFGHQIVLPRHVELVSSSIFLLNRALFIHYELFNLIETHEQGRLIVELVSEIVLQPCSILGYFFLIDGIERIFFARTDVGSNRQSRSSYLFWGTSEKSVNSVFINNSLLSGYFLSTGYSGNCIWVLIIKTAKNAPTTAKS